MTVIGVNERFSLYRDIQRYTGIYRDIQGYTEIYRDILS